MKQLTLLIISIICVSSLSGQNNIYNVYLEDTAYYEKKTFDQMIGDAKKNEGYMKYFNSVTAGLDYFLKDSLEDGCYYLYNLTRKQANKVKEKDTHIIATGCYKGGLKQGKFIFSNGIDKQSLGSIYKEISFINDSVNGNVLEMINGQIIYLCEYKMDVKEGFSFIYKQGQTVMRYFEHGVIRKELEFDIESSD
jgi:hypothetical protein